MINLWIDDHHIGYCVERACRIMDVTTGATTELRLPSSVNVHLAVVSPDGKHVFSSLPFDRVTRHAVTNFDAWPY